MTAERRAAAQITNAVLSVSWGPDDDTFGRRLSWQEAGSLLGAIGDALVYGPSWLGELRLSRVLRRAPRSELAEIANDLNEVSAPPWPQIRDAVVRLTDQVAMR